MSESDKLLSYETAKEMFEEFAAWMPEPGQPMPVYDEETGRYTNKSIERWMRWYADGLIYGVKVPKYDYDPTTEAIKTHANAGLVLEMSSPEVAGRNDYLGKLLFFCPRVNGGVDAGGMPYVTAIEGLDERFSATDANTWALTPVYYVRYVDIPSAEDPGVIAYVDQQFCDSPREGFVACAGAKLPDGTPRPYILRACYMDSCEEMVHQWTSKSGTVPACAWTQANFSDYGRYYPKLVNELVKERQDGLGYTMPGDFTYMIEFLQLMRGVKAPFKDIYPITGRTYTKVLETDYEGERVRCQYGLPCGLDVAVGSATSFNSAAGRSRNERAKVTSVEYASDEEAQYGGECWITLSADDLAIPLVGNYIWLLWQPNGILDGVQGTFGAYTLDNVQGFPLPYRFQNIEFGLGVHELVPGMTCAGYAFNYLSSIGKMASGFVKDFKRLHGAVFPAEVGATSTTGTEFENESTNSSSNEKVVVHSSISNRNQTYGGIRANGSMLSSNDCTGGRLSSIWYSAPAE